MFDVCEKSLSSMVFSDESTRTQASQTRLARQCLMVESSNALEDDAAAPAVFAPAEGWVVEVIREIALFDQPPCSVLDLQAGLPASGVDVPEPDVRDALCADRNASEVDGDGPELSGCRTEQPGAPAVDRHVRRFDLDRTVGSLRIENGVASDFQHIVSAKLEPPWRLPRSSVDQGTASKHSA